jgi:hypothetical protein
MDIIFGSFTLAISLFMLAWAIGRLQLMLARAKGAKMREPSNLHAFISTPVPRRNPEEMGWQPKRLWRPPGRWKILIEYAAIAGMGHRTASGEAFLKNAKRANKRGLAFALAVDREPMNAVDRNAIAVFGLSTGKAPEHLGYITAERAEQLTNLLPPDTEMAADFIGTFEAGGRETIAMRVLIPRDTYAALPVAARQELAEG